MAGRLFCESQERNEGVTNLNTTMTVFTLSQEKRLSGRYGNEHLDIFRFIYNSIRQDLGHR